MSAFYQNIFYLVFRTSNNIIKKEKVSQFALPIRQLHYKWILHKTTLSSISRLPERNKSKVSRDYILTILWYNMISSQTWKVWYFSSLGISLDEVCCICHSASFAGQPPRGTRNKLRVQHCTTKFINMCDRRSQMNSWKFKLSRNSCSCF